VSDTPPAPPPDSGPAAVDRVGERLRRANLDGADLAGVNLSRAELSAVTLRDADLEGARLCGAKLRHVDLTGARMAGADLRGARLRDVDLERATLDGADLRGASLKGVRIQGASAVGLILSGAQLDGVELGDTDLGDALLDGCEIQEGALARLTLRGADLRGLLATQCTLESSGLEDCDLSGATFETLLLKDSRLGGCDLRGALFRRSKLQGVTVDRGQVAGCVLEQCLGTEPALERQLEDGGALLSLPTTVRVWRRVRASRQVQLIVAAAALLAVVAALVLVLTPRWWPTAVLASKMEGLQAAGAEGWCDRQVKLGAILAGRRMTDTGRQLWLLGTAAECHAQAGRIDEAEALYLARMELPGADAEERLTAHVELGRFYANEGRFDDAARVAEVVGGDSRAPSTLRLEALRLQSDVLRGRGPVGPEVEDWVDLQIRIARTILAIEPPNADYLHDAPAVLYTLGAHGEAEELLAGIDPPVDRETAWGAAQVALDTLEAEDRVDGALALLAHLAATERYADEVSAALIRHARFELELSRERIEEARATRDELLALGTATGTSVAALATARLAVHDGDGAAALVALDDLGEALPTELGEDAVWARVDGHLLLDQEAVAMDALEPILVAVDDHDEAGRLLAAVERLARRMAEPGLASDLLRRVDNPLLAEMGGGRNVALAALRQRAGTGALTPDDPDLARLVTGNDTWAAIQGFDLLRDSARMAGDEGPALDAVAGWARDAGGERRAAFGLWLVDARVALGDRAGAAALIEELDLWSIPGQHRGRLYELACEDALAADDLTAARGWLARLQAEDPPLEAWYEHALVMPILRALEARGDWAALAELASRSIAASQARPEPVADHEISYRRERVRALIELGQGGQADAELAQVAAGNPCLAKHMEFESYERAGRDRWDAAALEGACAGAPGRVGDLLSICHALADRGEPARALAILDQRPRAGLEDHEWLGVQLARERFRAGSGDVDGALAALTALYPTLGDVEPRMQATQLLLDIHGERGDTQGVIDAYRRLAGDHPEADPLHLWEHAARTLARGGAADRIPELGGDPAWLGRVRDTVVEGSVRELLDAGDLDGAWRILSESATGATTDGERSALIWLSQEAADRGGAREEQLAVLDALLAGTAGGSEVWQRATLRRAVALHRLGRGEEALAPLEALLATSLLADVADEVLHTYGDLLGRHAATGEVAGKLAALERGSFEADRVLDVRFTVAEGLLRRGEADAARALLEPLEGKALSEALVRQRYHVLVRAFVDTGGAADAVDLPTRFPPARGVPACSVDIVLMQALPWGGPEAEEVRGRLESECRPAAMTADEVAYLAEVHAEADAARALALVREHRAATSPTGSAADRLSLMEARFLARDGQRDAAIAAFEALIDGASDGWIVADAAASLVGEIYKPNETATAAQAEAVVQRAVDRLEPGSHDVRHALRAMVGFHHARGQFAQALRWQRRVLELIPEGDEDRAYEVLTLVRLDLEGNGLGSSTWRTELSRGLAVLPAGGGAWRELARVQLATDLARQPREGAALEAAIRAAVEPIPAADRWNFVAAVADDLDWLVQRPETAEAVRQLNDGRF